MLVERIHVSSKDLSGCGLHPKVALQYEMRMMPVIWEA